MILYDRIRYALQRIQLGASPAHLMESGTTESLLQDLQQRLEDEHRQAREPTRLWACVATTDGAPACWVGTGEEEECLRCGSGMYMVAVGPEMHSGDREAVWLALCAGKLQLPRFGDEPCES